MQSFKSLQLHQLRVIKPLKLSWEEMQQDSMTQNQMPQLQTMKLMMVIRLQAH